MNQKAVEELFEAEIERGRWKAGEKLPTEQALAEEYGVGRMVIHRALASLQDRDIVVRRTRAGTFVAGPARSLKQVGVIMSDAAGYPQSAYLKGIVDALSEDCKVFICDTEGSVANEIAWAERLKRSADGVVVYATGDPRGTAALASLDASGVPVVCIDRYLDTHPLDAFVTEEIETSSALMRLLIESGHKRIAHFSDDEPEVSTVRERLNAYLSMIDEEAASDQRWVRLVPARGWNFPRLVQTIHDALAVLLSGPEPITAVFCAHDQYLAAVLAACEDMGLSTPGDLEIASYNDWPNLPIRRLDAVHRAIPPTFEAGRQAGLRLIARNAGLTESPKIERLPSTIVPASHRPKAGDIRIQRRKDHEK